MSPTPRHDDELAATLRAREGLVDREARTRAVVAQIARGPRRCVGRHTAGVDRGEALQVRDQRREPLAVIRDLRTGQGQPTMACEGLHGRFIEVRHAGEDSSRARSRPSPARRPPLP